MTLVTAFDQKKNFAVSSVRVAPSPALSGTTLTIQVGEGVRFPAPPFNIVVCPSGTSPTPANAEVFRVTAVAGDVFTTIVRAQEGSSARVIQVGDVIMLAVTAKAVQDTETNIGYYSIAGADLASAGTLTPTNYYHHVTGSTDVNNISFAGAVKGQRLKLLFTAGCSLLHNNGGGNVRLTANLHGYFAANESVELTFDGTNWNESGRSYHHLSGEEVPFGHTGYGGGYVANDGSAINRTAFHATFLNMGILFGAGDGSTTFNIPDDRGRMTVGHSPAGHTDVDTVGKNDGITSANFARRRPKHQSSMNLTASTGNDNVDHTHQQRALNLGGAGGAASSWEQFDSNDPNGTATSTTTAGRSSVHQHSVSFGGSIGSNNANDVIDAPAYNVKSKATRL